MSKSVVIISAHRQAYGIDDVLKKGTMTVGELVKYLEENFDEDSPLVLSHDNGYTYGGIRDRDIDETFDEESEDAE